MNITKTMLLAGAFVSVLGFTGCQSDEEKELIRIQLEKAKAEEEARKAQEEHKRLNKELVAASNVIQNLGAEYTAFGFIKTESQQEAQNSLNCFELDFANVSEGDVTLELKVNTKRTEGSADCPTDVFDYTKKRATSNGLVNSDGSAKTYSFGGKAFKW